MSGITSRYARNHSPFDSDQLEGNGDRLRNYSGRNREKGGPKR